MSPRDLMQLLHPLITIELRPCRPASEVSLKKLCKNKGKRVSLKVIIQDRATEIVGKGTIDGIVPFYFKDQGHRWMVRIGQHWTIKQEAEAEAVPTEPAVRNKMYWAIAQFRNQSRNGSSASAA